MPKAQSVRQLELMQSRKLAAEQKKDLQSCRCYVLYYVQVGWQVLELLKISNFYIIKIVTIKFLNLRIIKSHSMNRLIVCYSLV